MMIGALVLAVAVSAQATAERLVAELTPEERVGQLMMDSPAVPRLGIPAYHWWNEALHGIARAGIATVFPQSMAMAATFDADLQYRVADAISTETRAKHNLFAARGERGIYEGLTLWSPNVNLFRDPRWGRGQETFGEDPFLTGTMGVAFVKGIQGNDPKHLKAAACAKHFAVHSGPEALRHGFSAEVSPRDLAEYYLPAFKALVTEGKVEAVMGAYSALNGTPCCANKWLLTDLLREEWGFAGHVVSDVGAVRDILSGHHSVTDQVAACTAALSAGLDLCSEETYGCLRAALKDGRVSSDDLTRPLVNLYRTRAKLGQFEPKGSTPWDGLGAESVATPAHRALAREAAEKAMVLVHNNGVLPLDPEKGRGFCIVGPRAQDEVALYGNYNGYSAAPVTCATGIMSEAGPGVRCATDETWHYDVAIACVGITAEDEGEEGCSVNNAGGDRVEYGLPAKQIELLKSLKADRPSRKVVAVVFGCSPFDLKPLTALCDAIVVAWYPGEQGGAALGRLLFGLANFSGRLPVTYPTSYADLPDAKCYALDGRTYRYGEKAAYPFGFGLSYTSFSYANEVVRVEGDGDARKVVVSVDVTNTGKRDGEEVVQVYLRSPTDAGDRRVHHLAGFARVSLKAGETKAVTLSIPEVRFWPYGEDGKPVKARGRYTVFVGGGQPDVTPGVRSAEVELGAPQIAWPEGKRAAFYLSFDDGCPSQITNVFPRLAQYRIPGTFYVCPQWPLFTAHESDWATTNRYVVLGNHTFSHGKIADAAAFEKELSDCNAVLRRVGADPRWPRTIAFGIPGAERVQQIVPISEDELQSIYRRQHLVERLPWNGYPVTCRTIPEMEAYVDRIIREGGVGHLDFHGVGGDWLDPGLAYFDAVLKKLDANRKDLWFTTTAELADWERRPKPRPAQLARIREGVEVYGIVHWGLNTYTDREWGFGDEDPLLLDPAAFDADQIVGACKSGGLQGLIVVAKHHDGFCLWPTKTTDHNITKSPFRGGKGDYVKEMSDACARAGLRFGVYCSPWDRNNAAYATPAYVDTYHAQIKELLSGAYGSVFEMWFDGANGGDGYYGGAREKRTIPLDYYRFDEVFAFVRALQPGVCIFNESDGADYRWPGNERGELAADSRATIRSYAPSAYMSYCNRGDADGTTFHPPECDFPLRKGWFYHASETNTVRCGEYLMQRYLETVGNGGTMNLGIAPDRRGRLADEDCAALKRFGELRTAFFADEVQGAEAPCNVVVLQEDVSAGERVTAWTLGTALKGGPLGIKRIRVLPQPVPVGSLPLKVEPVGTAVSVRYYRVDPKLLNRVMNATTGNGETDTAQWMTTADSRP